MRDTSKGTNAARHPVYGQRQCKNPSCGATFTPVNKDHEYHSKTCKNEFYKLARLEGERRLLGKPAKKGGVLGLAAKETCRAAVLRILHECAPVVENWRIERAHPDHEMSGTRFLRFLKAEGVVSYTNNKKVGTYKILTGKRALKKAYIKELNQGD